MAPQLPALAFTSPTGTLVEMLVGPRAPFVPRHAGLTLNKTTATGEIRDNRDGDDNDDNDDENYDDNRDDDHDDDIADE